MSYIKKTLSILTNKNKKIFLLIIFFSIIKTFIELLSIGLLIPILTILSNSYKKNQIYINFPFFSHLNESQLLLVFVLFFIIIYLVRTIYLIFFNIFSAKYSHNLYLEISEKLLNSYLKKKFTFFIQNNSAALVEDVASETNNFAVGTIGAYTTFFSNLILFLAICALLIFYNYNFIFIIIILFFVCGLVLSLSKNKLSKLGKIRQLESYKMIQKLNEVIGSIKEIVLYSKSDFFINQVKKPLKNFSNAAVYKDAFTSITSPIVEFVAIIIFLNFFLYLIFYSQKSFNEIIVIFGIFFYGTIRLLPTLLSMARSIQLIRFNFPATDKIFNSLPKNKKYNKIINYPVINVLKNIIFKKVDFTYPQQNYPVLKNINLKVNIGDKIGIIGETGGGKTTLINLISGLLQPTKGKILINSKKIFDSNKFKINIGYVSQSVYLFDEDIISNITLSNDLSKVKMDFIDGLLKNLNLDNFKYKKHINKTLGERGIKISGGQIQRIGIARALYREPSLLILDEATNALDEKTENKILAYLFKKFKNKIIIFCTHKKKLLNYCNKIIEIKDHKINFIK